MPKIINQKTFFPLQKKRGKISPLSGPVKAFSFLGCYIRYVRMSVMSKRLEIFACFFAWDEVNTS